MIRGYLLVLIMCFTIGSSWLIRRNKGAGTLSEDQQAVKLAGDLGRFLLPLGFKESNIFIHSIGGTTKEAVEGAFSFGAGITGVPTVYSNDFPGIPDSGTVIRVKVGESLGSDVEMKVILKKSDGYNFTIIGTKDNNKSSPSVLRKINGCSFGEAPVPLSGYVVVLLRTEDGLGKIRDYLNAVFTNRFRVKSGFTGILLYQCMSDLFWPEEYVVLTSSQRFENTQKLNDVIIDIDMN